MFWIRCYRSTPPKDWTAVDFKITSAELLKLPAVSQRIQESHMSVIDSDESKQEFLKTIQVPENLRMLKEFLPKANYEPLKLKTEERESFIQRLEKKKLSNRNFQSLASLGPLKHSGLKRRREPPGIADNTLSVQRTDDRSLLAGRNRSVETLPKISHPLGRSNLPSDQKKPLNTFDMKLKYLNKKKFEDKYQKESLLLEEHKNRNISPDEYAKKYESAMTNLKL